MSCIRGLLSNYCLEVERKLKPHLDGMTKGALIRTKLPQSWNFKTEEDEVLFNVDKQGNTSVSSGQTTNPDVTIEWKHDYLSSVLRKRSIEGIPPGEEPEVIIHTSKGQIGYNMIRKHIGI